MSSSTYISLYYNGRQADYDATFVCNDESSIYFQVTIGGKKILFEGGIDHSFELCKQQENLSAASDIDSVMIEAFRRQMDRMFL